MLIKIILLILAIPVGLLIASLTPEELKSGQRYFKAIIVLFAVVGVWSYSIGQIHIAWTSAFVMIVAFISLLKSIVPNTIF